MSVTATTKHPFRCACHFAGTLRKKLTSAKSAFASAVRAAFFESVSEAVELLVKHLPSYGHRPTDGQEPPSLLRVIISSPIDTQPSEDATDDISLADVEKHLKQFWETVRGTGRSVRRYNVQTSPPEHI